MNKMRCIRSDVPYGKSKKIIKKNKVKQLIDNDLFKKRAIQS
jgi:stalled ribosome alternative rescue factor ArfA